MPTSSASLRRFAKTAKGALGYTQTNKKTASGLATQNKVFGTIPSGGQLPAGSRYLPVLATSLTSICFSAMENNEKHTIQ